MREEKTSVESLDNDIKELKVTQEALNHTTTNLANKLHESKAEISRLLFEKNVSVKAMEAKYEVSNQVLEADKLKDAIIVLNIRNP